MQLKAEPEPPRRRSARQASEARLRIMSLVVLRNLRYQLSRFPTSTGFVVEGVLAGASQGSFSKVASLQGTAGEHWHPHPLLH
jgi:hypothetical protein